MPHITLDYSANMEARTDIAALCCHLRQAAAATGVSPCGHPGARLCGQSCLDCRRR